MPGFSLGGSKSSGSSSSFVDPKQQPFLDFGRNRARDLARQNLHGAQQFAGQSGADLYSSGRANIDALTNNPFLSGLQQQAGGNPELVQQQIGQLGTDLGNFYQQQLQPGIGRDYQGIGAQGGSRQAIDEGFARQSMADAFSRGATDIYGADATRSLQAGTAGGGLMAQGAMGAVDLLSGLSDVGMGQFTGGFAPLLAYNNIIGPPTVLDKSRNKSMSLQGSVGV